MKEKFIRIEECTKLMELHVNESKTKIMASHPPSRRAASVGLNLTIGESNFEIVINFKYFGSYIHQTNSTSNEIKIRFLTANKCELVNKTFKETNS